MDFEKYLNIFQDAVDQLDKSAFDKHQIEITVGVFLDSVALKLYKKSWANPFQDPVTSKSRIFFSIWINDSTIKEQKLYYNIHALKLRKLEGYSIESRKFAETFRKEFKKFAYKWQNVSVKYGPLTLMEGWIAIDLQNFKNEIVSLASNFLEIEGLVDETLIKFKK
jgi:hypothetical protein